MKTYSQRLTTLATYLRRRPHTVTEIAEKFGVSKFCVYERIAALKKSGVEVLSQRVRRYGVTGPAPKMYLVTR